MKCDKVAENLSNAPKEGHSKTVLLPENKNIVIAAFVHFPKKSICRH